MRLLQQCCALSWKASQSRKHTPTNQIDLAYERNDGFIPSLCGDQPNPISFLLNSLIMHTQVDPDSLCPDVKFIEQMGSLLDDDEHCDVTFFVGPNKTEVGFL